MDYLERAYYEPWDFSFSGQPPEGGESSSAIGDDLTPAAPAIGHARASVPTLAGSAVRSDILAVVAAGAAMVACHYLTKGLLRWARFSSERAAQKRRGENGESA